MGSAGLFSHKADQYASARPSYPEALIGTMYNEFHLTSESVLADIGCGTGKFSELLLRRGSRVIGIEPDDAMRAKAAAKLTSADPGPQSGRPGLLFSAAAGSAEHTGLPDASVDAVTAAQAFHWFDTGAFRQECCRILCPEGLVFLIWNLRDPELPVTGEIAALYRRFSPRFHGFNNGFTEKDPRIPAFFPQGYERRRFDNPLSYDRDTFITRCESSSHAPQPGTPELEEYRRQPVTSSTGSLRTESWFLGTTQSCSPEVPGPGAEPCISTEAAIVPAIRNSRSSAACSEPQHRKKRHNL